MNTDQGGRPADATAFLELVRKSGLIEERRLDACLAGQSTCWWDSSRTVASVLVHAGLLTQFQADMLLFGKWTGFTIGKSYRVLESLGSGGRGSVYLCRNLDLHRRMAVKVLPAAKAAEPTALERFSREVRVLAALDHPNVLTAYDAGEDEGLYFLIMGYVDGATLEEIIERTGPMDVSRACHYVRQAALGLQHVHERHLIHRNVAPSNVMVDRQGIVKIIDFGVARFVQDQNGLAMADYLPPQQGEASPAVDFRADTYSLGATFYFCLAGRPPFPQGTAAEKLIWHQTRKPEAIQSIRSDVPAGVAAIIDRMMAKDPGQRYATAKDVAEALAVWTQTPIPPPPESEMPQLCLAARSDA